MCSRGVFASNSCANRRTESARTLFVVVVVVVVLFDVEMELMGALCPAFF